ncbi:MAG: DUF1579 domain-containing protein [Planctomycetota bacterium]|nr:MAG: DUF1579 domain-containing protein [Planctomycetota bacterium]
MKFKSVLLLGLGLGSLASSAVAQMPEPMPAHVQKFLQQQVGSWDCTVQVMTLPDAPPLEFKGVMNCEMVLGNQFLMQEFYAKMPETFGGGVFEGYGLDGWEHQRRTSVGVWMESTPNTVFEANNGEVSEDGMNRISFIEAVDPLTGAKVKKKGVHRLNGQDEMTYTESSMDENGEEAVSLNILFQRRKEAAKWEKAKSFVAPDAGVKKFLEHSLGRWKTNMAINPAGTDMEFMIEGETHFQLVCQGRYVLGHFRGRMPQEFGGMPYEGFSFDVANGEERGLSGMWIDSQPGNGLNLWKGQVTKDGKVAHSKYEPREGAPGRRGEYYLDGPTKMRYLGFVAHGEEGDHLEMTATYERLPEKAKF